MKRLLMVTAILVAAPAAAWAGSIQDYSLSPHPSPYASSNDRSKNPSAAVRQTYSESFRHSRNYYAPRHHRVKKHRVYND